MIVHGGAYAVGVSWPNRYDPLGGSGVRAAQALTLLDPVLVTAADTQSTADLEEMFPGRTQIAHRDRAVRFNYFTPLHRPEITGGDAVVDTAGTTSEDAFALTFGMIERDQLPVPRAETQVIDVQNPRHPTLEPLLAPEARRVVLSVNRAEAAKLTGSANELTAAAKLLDEPKVIGVIVKNGPLGAVVHTRERRVVVGAYPTRTVWPIGSGDLFSAGVVGAMSLGADVVEAARIGSAAAALGSGAGIAAIPSEVLSGRALVRDDIDAAMTPQERQPVIYLAAPFFTLGQRWLVDFVRGQLIAMGARVFSPLHDVGTGGDEVAAADLDGLRGSDAVLALLDGWDPGTIYEAGWAHRHNIPVVGLLSTTASEEDKMLVGSGAEIHRHVASAIYRAIWIGNGAPVHAGRYA